MGAKKKPEVFNVYSKFREDDEFMLVKDGDMVFVEEFCELSRAQFEWIKVKGEWAIELNVFPETFEKLVEKIYFS